MWCTCTQHTHTAHALLINSFQLHIDSSILIVQNLEGSQNVFHLCEEIIKEYVRCNIDRYQHSGHMDVYVYIYIYIVACKKKRKN